MKRFFFTYIIITGLLFSCTNKGVNNIKNSFIDVNKFYIKEIGYKKMYFDSLENIPIEILVKIDSLDPLSIKQKENNAAQYFYYSILDTVNYYSLVYLYYNEAKAVSFMLVNYNKSGSLLGEEVISSMEGDGGWFSNSKGKFINDSTIIREDSEGYYGLANNLNSNNQNVVIEKYNKLQISLSNDGSIKIDTLTR